MLVLGMKYKLVYGIIEYLFNLMKRRVKLSAGIRGVVNIFNTPVRTLINVRKALLYLEGGIFCECY